MTGTLAIVLVLEPSTSNRGPIPLVRVSDPTLALKVAQLAIKQSEAQASELLQIDESLGESEMAEARKLRQTLSLLVPGVSDARKTAAEILQ